MKNIDLLRKLIFWIVDTAKRRMDFNVGVELVNYNGGERIEILNRIKALKKEIEYPMENCEAYTLVRCALNTNKLSGDVAEVGCYNGGSTRLIGENKGDRQFHVFDTFEGLPARTKEDEGSANYSVGEYTASLDSVQKVMQGIMDVFYYKGLFPDTSEPVKDKTFSFVHLDVDLYRATHDSLVFFYPRMVKGGIIISHDYNGCPGVKKAFDDFFADKPEPLIEMAASQVLILKT